MAHLFTQTFNLHPTAEGGYHVYNDPYVYVALSDFIGYMNPMENANATIHSQRRQISSGAISILTKHTDRVMVTIANDTLEGSHVWKTLAMTCLSTILGLFSRDRSPKILHYIVRQNVVRRLVDWIRSADSSLKSLLAGDTGEFIQFLIPIYDFWLLKLDSWILRWWASVVDLWINDVFVRSNCADERRSSQSNREFSYQQIVWCWFFEGEIHWIWCQCEQCSQHVPANPSSGLAIAFDHSHHNWTTGTNRSSSGKRSNDH